MLSCSCRSHEERQDLKQQGASLPPSVRASAWIAKGLECWGIPRVCIKSSNAACPAVGIAVIAPLLAQMEEVRCAGFSNRQQRSVLKAGFLRCISLTETKFSIQEVFGKRTPRRRALSLPSFLSMVHWQSQPFSLQALFYPWLSQTTVVTPHQTLCCYMQWFFSSTAKHFTLSQVQRTEVTGGVLLHLVDLGGAGTFTCLFMSRWSKRVAGNGKAKELSLWFHLPGAYGFPGEVSHGWEGMHQSN